MSHAKVRDLVFDESVRDLCVKPYHGHPKGCPNAGKRKTCPPFAPLLGEVYDLSKDSYLIWNVFDFAGHVERMRAAHPSWSERQLACCLYWQEGARAALEVAIKVFRNTMAPGFSFARCPEAMGLNVTATLKSAVGWELEWPPKTRAVQVAFAGKRRDRG
jgi:hypothetical protein